MNYKQKLIDLAEITWTTKNVDMTPTNEEKYNLFNPHPAESYKYTHRDMLDCWIAARENLVRWGVGQGDKPDFSVWIKEYYLNHKSVRP